MTEPMKVFEITITRTIHPDGQQGFSVTMPEEFSFIEGLGLLDAARWTLFQQMTDRYGGVR
jgi:hypothetical protein